MDVQMDDYGNEMPVYQQGYTVEYDMDGNPIAEHYEDGYGEEDYGDEEEMPAQEGNEDDLNFEDFRNIIETTEDAAKNQLMKMGKANFIKAGTPLYQLYHAIKSGDQAISFFAKHGNNMPIRFINCNRKPVPKSEFRPYDLVTVLDDEKNDERALDTEYFVISAQGVTHVINEKVPKHRATGHTPTEVLTLSEWMMQSTMFNVLTTMKFFKTYLIGKVFGLWKGNVRRRQFNKRRQQLAKNLIPTRPDFLPTYLNINTILYEMQSK